mmetsp:Transcript_57712/g.91740  ORF Transcript_57712/g.91740 Transcript_57712/m.91740 type:complete len:535 (-) Transcript_57712:115-1719(-)
MLHSATAATLRLNLTLGAIREAYTTNAICGKKNCINPVFPGMEDLHRLTQERWICSSLQKSAPYMGFCKNAIAYDPALPQPIGGGAATVESLVQRQDNAASTMFYYHMSGLGLDAWDYQKPEFADDCTKSIWRMVCYTYFPRAEVGCQDGALSQYLRPCQSSCMNYIRSCNVECCDESVQCVFTHSKKISDSQVVTTEGYAPHYGPSSLCTGAANRSATPLSFSIWILLALQAFFCLESLTKTSSRRLVFLGSLIAIGISLQGCDYDVPIHRVGNWRGQPDYLVKYEFIPPGASVTQGASLNSCSLQRLSQTLQCSGRGVCKLWDPNNLDNKLAFCECDRDYADPECRTKRKSQTIAYFLSMFFGMFGADHFYLGFIGTGILKLFTLGGGGLWWIYDIIRIGSAPVYTPTYKVGADLPHPVFVVTCVLFGVLMGFAIAYNVTVTSRANKRKEAMLMQGDEEARQKEIGKPFADALGPGMRKPVLKPDSYGSMMGGPMMGMGGPMMGSMMGTGGPMMGSMMGPGMMAPPTMPFRP